MTKISLSRSVRNGLVTHILFFVWLDANEIPKYLALIDLFLHLVISILTLKDRIITDT